MDISRRDTLRVFGATAPGALFGASDTARAGAIPEPILRAIPSSGERIPVIGLGTWSTFDVDSSPRRARRSRRCSIPATSKRAHLDDDLDAARGRLPDEKLRRRMAEAF